MSTLPTLRVCLESERRYPTFTLRVQLVKSKKKKKKTKKQKNFTRDEFIQGQVIKGCVRLRSPGTKDALGISTGDSPVGCHCPVSQSLALLGFPPRLEETPFFD